MIYKDIPRSLRAGSRPVLFDLGKPGDVRRMRGLRKRAVIAEVVDEFESQLRELFAVDNPTLAHSPEFSSEFKKFLNKLKKIRPLYEWGRWVYFPWLAALVHILPEPEFYRVRTARNRYLISQQEQDLFYQAVVGVAGLSVGSSVALAIVLQGGAKHIKLADLDHLELSNLNRIRSGVEGLGLNKAELTARQIYAMNPYAQVEIFPDGLSEKNIQKFFGGHKSLSVMIDEIDNLEVKYLIRQEARRRGVAVVMAADNGDDGVVDVERYDQNKSTPFFHGRMGKISRKKLAGLNKLETGRLITRHVGLENVTERMQRSLTQIGRSIVSWPQLGGAAMLNGAAVAYCVRKIVAGGKLESNRGIVSLDAILTPDYNHPRERERRRKAASAFKKIFRL